MSLGRIEGDFVSFSKIFSTFFDKFSNKSVAGELPFYFVELTKYHWIRIIAFSLLTLYSVKGFSITSFENSCATSSLITSSVRAILSPFLPPKLHYLSLSTKISKTVLPSILICFTNSSQLM